MTEQEYEQEPHEGYMRLVADALREAGIAPDSWHAEDNGGDRLDGVFTWNKHNPLTPLELFPRGVVVSWDQFDGWQYSPIDAQGFLGDFRELVDTAYADPSAVVTAARLLLKGHHHQLPVHDAAGWSGGRALYDAITTWMHDLPE